MQFSTQQPLALFLPIIRRKLVHHTSSGFPVDVWFEFVMRHRQAASDHGGDWQRLNGLVEAEKRLANRVKSLLGEWEKLGIELA